MDEDVIQITFDYRIGVFGFLSTGDSIIPGNNGLKDMVILLKWVKTYISSFGGNPEKVTIFGDSAGSIVVHLFNIKPLNRWTIPQSHFSKLQCSNPFC